MKKSESTFIPHHRGQKGFWRGQVIIVVGLRACGQAADLLTVAGRANKGKRGRIIVNIRRLHVRLTYFLHTHPIVRLSEFIIANALERS